MSMMGKAVGQQEDSTVISNSKDMVDTLDRLLKELEVAEEKQTNFDRITASPESLAKFIHEAESVYERCVKGDLNCDYCKCQWCGLAGKKELIDWLMAEVEE